MATLSSLRERFSKLLLAAFLLTGFSLTFVLPPFQAPDEDQHWISATIRYDGLLSGDGRSCSAGLGLPEHFECARIHSGPQQKIASSAYERLPALPTACMDDPIGYGTFLTYPGVGGARLMLPGMSANPRTVILQFYAARLLHGLLIFILLSRLAALGSPLSLLAFATSPLFIQQSFAISSDVTTNAFALALAIMLLAWERVNRWDWLALGALGLSASLTKPTIMPAILGATACVICLRGYLSWRDLSKKQWSNSPEGRSVLGFAIGMIALASVCLFVALAFKFGPTPQGDPLLQKEFVFTNPWRVLTTIVISVVGIFTIPPFHGPLGWLDTWLPTHTRNLWLLTFLIAMIIDLTWTWARGIRPRKEAAIGFAFATTGLFASLLLIGYTLYLSFTPVGETRVHGLQGRYFFAHIVLLLASLFACLAPAVPPQLTLTKAALNHQSDSEVPSAWQTRLVNVSSFGLGSLLLYIFVHTIVAVALRYW